MSTLDFSRFTEKAAEAVQSAQAEARRRNQQQVDLWHLPPGIQTASPGGADATTISLGSVRKPAAVQAIIVQATAELAQSPIEQRGGFRAIADEVRELERRKMVEALIETGGVQNLAAALIQMPLRTFATKLKRYAITADEWSAPKR